MHDKREASGRLRKSMEPVRLRDVRGDPCSDDRRLRRSRSGRLSAVKGDGGNCCTSTGCMVLIEGCRTDLCFYGEHKRR